MGKHEQDPDHELNENFDTNLKMTVVELKLGGNR